MKTTLDRIEEVLSTNSSILPRSDIAALVEYVRVYELRLTYLKERQKEKFWAKGITQEKITDRLRRAREKLGLEPSEFYN